MGDPKAADKVVGVQVMIPAQGPEFERLVEYLRQNAHPLGGGTPMMVVDSIIRAALEAWAAKETREQDECEILIRHSDLMREIIRRFFRRAR